MPGFFGPFFYQVIVPKMAICYSNFTIIVCFLVFRILRSYAQNVVFDIQKKRTKLPKLGGWRGG